MILFALTPRGLTDAKALAAQNSNVAIWCPAEAMTEQESGAAGSISVTRFSLPLKGDGNPRLSMKHAMDVIREHHPDETVWIEANGNE